MVRYFALLFIVFFSFYSGGSSNFLIRCYKNFRPGLGNPSGLKISVPIEEKKPKNSNRIGIKYNLSEKTQWKNSKAGELFSFVYQQLPLLQENRLSPLEQKRYISDLEGLIHLLESDLSSDVKSRLKLIGSQWSSAVRAFPAIVSFMNSGKAAEYRFLDASTILKLVILSFGRYTRAYLTHSSAHSLNWSAFQMILKSISDFKDNPSVIALYNIERAVRENFSILNFINCK